MKKSGSSNFLPTYNTANQYATLPSGTPSYAPNGVVNNDGFHSYYWDSEGKNVRLDTSTTMTYDAFGRWVERNVNGRITQAVYGPDGSEAAVMFGQTVVAYYVRVPGGAVATYGSSGLYSYWHPDWLGTARLYSTPARTVINDAAVAAYGEQYQGSPLDTMYTGVGQAAEGSDLRTFPARNLSVLEGRWLSPDPAGLRAVDLANPQSLNRYAYVMANPLGLVDPTGMIDADPTFRITGTACRWYQVLCWFGAPTNDVGPPIGSTYSPSFSYGNDPIGGGGGGGTSASAAAPAKNDTRNVNCVAFQAVNAAYPQTTSQTLEYGGFLVKKPDQTYYYSPAFAGSQISMGTNMNTQYNNLTLTLQRSYPGYRSNSCE